MNKRRSAKTAPQGSKNTGKSTYTDCFGAAQADPDPILHFYRKLLALRQSSNALRSGTFRLLLPERVAK